MKFLISIFIFLTTLLFLGCNNNSSQKEYSYRVYSNAPVLRAVVEDAQGQLATQNDLTQNVYTFAQHPTYPLKAYSNGLSTFVDSDFDGNKTAFDIELNSTLYSASSVITLATTLAFDNADFNTSAPEYNTTNYDKSIEDIARRYAIAASDLKSKTPLQTSNTRLAILSDTLAYAKATNDYNASNLDAFSSRFNSIEEFFTHYLTHLSDTQKVQYHSAYETLELLDMKKAVRSIKNIMPVIPAFLNTSYSNIVNLPPNSHLSSVYNTSNNLAYWAIKADDNNSIAYVAAGNDGFDTVVSSAPEARLENHNQNLNGFATAIETLDVNDSRCIFVAEQKNQIEIYTVFPLSNVSNTNASDLLGSYKASESNATSFDVKYVNTNANNLEYLLVANGKAGLHILDVKDITCKDTLDLNDSHRINSNAIGTDTHSVVSSSNKKVIYVADGVNGLIAVDISASIPEVLQTKALENNESAYNLHKTPNSNELYVSTDKGIQIYNTDNTGNMIFRGSYKTEGSRANALGETLRVARSHNAKALFIADISGGLKVLDISDSTNPKLCGAGYFSAKNEAERSAVRDIALSEESGTSKRLLVANDSNGLLSIENARDLLFNHCKELLE